MDNERRDAVLGRLERLIQHLLQLEFSPSDRPRRRWMLSVVNARAALRRRLARALRHVAEDELADVYDTARRQAALELADQDERDAARSLPKTCPYSLDQLLDPDWLPANRHGLLDDGL